MLYRTATSPGAVWKFFMLSLMPILGTYFFGSYWPLFARLDAKSIFTIYAIFFGVCGMTISFFYEDSLSNPNVGKMLCLFLYITGLAFVYYAIQSEVIVAITITMMTVIAIVWHTGLLKRFSKSAQTLNIENEGNEVDAKAPAPATPSVLPISPAMTPRDTNVTYSPVSARTGSNTPQNRVADTDGESPGHKTPKRYYYPHPLHNVSEDEMSPLVKYSNQIHNASTGSSMKPDFFLFFGSF